MNPIATESTITTPSAWTILSRLNLLVGLERRILAIIASYAVVIGLFALIVPLTVQELVNTFAFAIQPIMIVTLVAIMLGALLLMGAFRVLQGRAVEILVQRIYTRLAVAFTEALPRFRENVFLPQHTNTFIEAELLPRALVAMLVDIINVFVSGMIGMTILIMYHPYFLGYNIFLITGFAFLLTFFGRGGLRITQRVSNLHYQTFHWLQDIGINRLHFKSTDSLPLLLKKTDALVQAYVMARKTRSDILTGAQYKSTVIFQAIAHSSMIGLGGWLLSLADITLGQFVAAEVIVGTLLLNLDIVARRMYAAIYVATSMQELSRLFEMPKEEVSGPIAAWLPNPTLQGVRLTCKDVSFASPEGPMLFDHFNLEVLPGEKISVLTGTSKSKTSLALLLAGLYHPTSGVIRYNDIDLRDVSLNYVNRCRGLMLDSHPTLFDGTLEENVTLQRPSIQFADLSWALRFVELEEEIDALPLGLETVVHGNGANLSRSQVLRILLARMIVTRPELLIFNGSLHNIDPTVRLTLLRRLCAKEEPWSIVFVSNDPEVGQLVERRVILD
ncbi:MAG: ABC transporter ATP-binding protein/permease [Nitrospira sp.]|nr:ABC transporter ATP-binding protein [Nitrospira sp.]MBX3369397.1 ABC transporter ATP-binding protein [Nitrospira sp.]MBX7039460.1 ABC transporter ATP-binding protein/permease [Nitrospira sp.]HMU31091.1 ABC transporter ATP-binding protein [Nitrospira sp.]HMV57724.1 ABC transporter ATP-binding protein [Nitrospira sp.]